MATDTQPALTTERLGLLDTREQAAFSLLGGRHVLLMLSGGKDSVLCAHLCQQAAAQVRAVHFTHRWSSQIPTGEAVQVCNELSLELSVIDLTDRLLEVAPMTVGPFCKTCKRIMAMETVAHASANGSDVICTGDTLSDLLFSKSLGTKLMCNAYSALPNLFFSRYLGSTEVDLPDSIAVFRPLIHMLSDEVRTMLDRLAVQVNYIGETGDKYEYYGREGCCLQYLDPGVRATEPLMDELFSLNQKATQMARQLGVRASVRVPSRQVVTVPRGYEDRIRETYE